jgi:nicotinamide-nucleotide amidase
MVAKSPGTNPAAARLAFFPGTGIASTMLDRPPPSIVDLATELLAAVERAGLSVVTAESCTAGLISQALSDAPGSAERFHGGFITYTKQQKSEALGVSPWLLAEKGAVCGEVAAAMAEGALERSPAELAVAVTGVAGPEPDEDGNPVGRVCIATARRGEAVQLAEFEYGAIGRDAVRERATSDAIRALRTRV